MMILVLQAAALVVLAWLLRTPEAAPQEIREESDKTPRRRR